MKDSRNKYLLKNTFILSLGNFGTKIITFFLVPLYTNILTTAEYGTIDIITIIGTVIVPIITLNIQEAVLRFSMDKECDSEKIISIAFSIIMLSSFASILCWPILKIIPVTASFAISLVFYMLFISSSHILLCYLRGKEKLLDYSIISIIQTLMIAILNIYFLVYRKNGINGYIWAYNIAYFVTFVLCIIRGNLLKCVRKIKIDKELFKDMVKYSIILIPNSLMWWIMNSLDRVMITSMLGVESNGIYAVSYKIPTIVITITTIFNQAWMYSAVKEKDSEDKSEYTNKIYSTLINIVITVSLFLLLILKPLMSIYVGKEFYSAWMYTPYLIVGTVFLTIGTFIANEYTAHKDSWGYLKSSTIGAILNVILNLILIPLLGINGAAIATCISYIVVFIYRVVDTRKYVKLKVLDNEKIICIVLLLFSSIIIYMNGITSYILLLISLIIMLLITRKMWANICRNITKKLIRRGK